MPEVELPDPEELEELGKKGQARKVALCTAIFAVVLAVSSLGGNNATKDMMLAQQQASDQWAYYQAKVIRENLYKVEKEKLEAELAERGGTLAPEAKARYETLLKEFAASEEKYKKDKEEIKEKATELEKERDHNRAKDPYFDYAEVLLQIGIVMASLAILSGSNRLFHVSLVLAISGALLALNGFTLLVKIPFLAVEG